MRRAFSFQWGGIAFRALGAFLAVVALPQTTSAGEIPGSSFRYGNWQGSGWTNDQTGEFSHCAVNAPFVSGDTLLFSVNRQGSVSVGVTNPNFRFDVGQQFPVSIFVDRRAPFYGTARAVSSDFAVLEIRDFDRALTAFKKGYLMRIETPNGVGRYDLTGTFRALERATQCAYRYYRYTSTPTPYSDGEAPVDKTILFQVASEVINELGLGGFRFLTNEELKEMGSSQDTVRWVAEEFGVEGAAFLASSSGLGSLRETDSVDTQYIANSCEGDFATSARQIDYSEADARELRLICTFGDNVKETYVSKVLIGDWVLYSILTFTMSGSEEPIEDRQAVSERAAIRAANYIIE